MIARQTPAGTGTSSSDSRLTSPSRLAAVRATGLLDGRANEVLDRITRLATRLLGVPISLASLVGDVAQYFPGLTGVEGWAGTSRSTPLTYSFCQHVVRSGEPFLVENAAEHLMVRSNLGHTELGVTAYAGVPLRTFTGELLGAFCVVSTQPRVWTHDDIETLSELASMAMAEIELRLTTRDLLAAHDRLGMRLVQDALTGLPNRQGFLEAGQTALAQARMDGTPYVLAMLEIDDFRLVNTTGGYEAGDALLLEVATLLTAAFRDDDLVARTGSDDFAVLVRQATASDVPFISARIDAALDVHNASPLREHKLGLRSGFAVSQPAVPVSVATLMQLADNQLQVEKLRRRGAAEQLSPRHGLQAHERSGRALA